MDISYGNHQKNGWLEKWGRRCANQKLRRPALQPLVRKYLDTWHGQDEVAAHKRSTN
jgi:hypothetical protein